MKTQFILTSDRRRGSLLWERTLRVSLAVAALLVVTSASAAPPVPLREQIQKQLDASPYLAAQQVKMRVVAERQGNVTLEMTEGPKQLRDLLRRGYELNGSALAEVNLEPDSVKALRCVRRTLTLIKGIKEVQEISLTGALTSSVTPAEKPSDTPTPQKTATTLEEQIQKELDASPYLATQQVKMRVVAERQGSVTLEMTEGPKQLRDLLRRGYELNGSALDEANLEPDSVKALRCVKRTLTPIKAMKGVEEISLTGALTSSVTPAEKPSDTPTPQKTATTLEEHIQKELDASPYLAAQQVKMRVVAERQGNVTLEMTEGPKQLRDLLRRGYEINGSALDEANLEPDSVKALRCVKRTLTLIKGIKEVQEISLTGALSPSVSLAENPSDQLIPQEAENPLWEQIQKQLDASPYLAAQQVKMRVVAERQGNVTLEVTEGPKQLRDLVRKGYEINGNGLSEAKLNVDAIKALRCVKRTVTLIKGIKGVQEISLTGALNPLMDQAENYYEEASQQLTQSDSKVRMEAIPLLIKSAEMGFVRAQAELAKAYQDGVDVREDDGQAFFWLQKAAAQGDVLSQFQLATRCLQGHGTDKDYKQAIAWYQKVARQDSNPDVRIRSQIALASILATCPNETLRDGNAALEYAKKGEAAAPNGIAIEALAAAYARCERFEEAIEQQKKWIQQLENAKFLAPDEKESLLDHAKKRLQSYQQHTAYTTEE